jgi:diguanylate cyclase
MGSSLVSELRYAIERDELELHYQPKVCTHSGTILGAEALMRWRSPSRGFVPPTEFIPIAERSGLIGRLGEWAIETACRHASQQWGRSSTAAPIPVSVNISPVELQAPRPAKVMKTALNRFTLSPSLLEIELTESAALADLDNECLREIADLGVRLAIDDFGAGYSNLSKLGQLPIHTLKLDRSMIVGIAASGRDRCIVRTIIEMAHELDMHVVVEGVESDAQLAILQALKCDAVQGFVIARPMDAVSFGAWLDRHVAPTPRARVETAHRTQT